MNLTIETDITTENPFKICFVCLGNICRSPTAEGIFQHLVNERGLQAYFEVDSAGTSAYHSGQSANQNSQRTANKYGITLHSKARQFKTFDLDYFDLILAMDNQNLANINRLTNDKHGQKVRPLRAFDPDPEHGEVPDPYAGGREGFENVFKIVKRSCEHLLDELETHIQK
ncbi:MAG TPA: low molecular weight protein-tyrosine-phosphatase [Balneolaceae bacterium]|nr:low molecular weight protein-tyrosine-phosphatase [Balneolaceae bacterium]